MAIELRTPRLVLRRLRPGDAVAVFAYRSDPHVARYQTWEPADVADVRAFVERLQGLAPDSPGTWFQFGIALQESGRLIGDCGLHFPQDEPRQAELGVTLAPAHQGLGYATETLQALLGYAFEELAKHRVYARVDPRNVASRALMTRVGMREEGHLRESVWHEEQWADDVIYAMLDWEWRARLRALCT